MIVPVHSHLDLTGHELLNALLQVLASDPASPIEGQVWYHSGSDTFRYRDGTGTRQIVSQTVLDAAVALLQARSEKGQANGYASLDAGGKIPSAQLPTSTMEFKGVWNAATNSPTLADGTGDTGDTYRVSVAGTRNLGSGAIDFQVGDLVIYNGTIWEHSDTTDAVSSVAGKTGVVTLVKADVGLANVDNTSDANKPVSTAQQAALDLKADDADLTAHINDTSDAHDATAISFAPAGSIEATTVQAAIEEVASEAGSGSGTVNKFADDIVGDAAATQFTVTHNLGTTDVGIFVYDVSSDVEIIVTKKRPTANTVRIDFTSAPANGKTYRVVVVG